jgi:hypothetical protein
VRLNALSQYPGTALKCLASEYDVQRVSLLLDVPPLVENNPYAREQPALFPFHSRYVPEAEWRQFVGVLHALFTLVCVRSEWLYDVIATPGIGAWRVGLAILGELGDLTRIPKSQRRLAEVRAFDALYGGGNHEEKINVQHAQRGVAANTRSHPGGTGERSGRPLAAAAAGN